MSENPNKPNPAEPSDAARRMRERVQALLKQDAAKASGRVRLASGAELAYDSNAAFVPVNGADGEPEAAIFTTAYTVPVAEGAAPRPLCFAFNGGPGSASLWLHLGALGPKRVRVPDDGSMPLAPYAIEDNPLTWLEHFDLVFVDPAHTGYSLCASDDARKKMLSVDGDVASLSEAVRVWLARHRRFASPLYLAGESYGTTRGAALADSLASQGIALAGLILVSLAMDIQTLSFDAGNDLPYALFLPAFANVAQYHGLLKGPVAASSAVAREAAEAFAAEDYPVALLAGARLSPQRQARVAKRLSELTGLPQALVEEHNLRISDQAFFFEAMRGQGRIVGRLDARSTGPMAAQRTRNWEFDPGIEAISAPYTMLAQHHFHSALGVHTEQRYEALNVDVNRHWKWTRGEATGNSYCNTTPDLARVMRRLPHLKLLVASGRYDLGTPYSASDHCLAQLDVPAEVRQRITHRYYDAGHMMYTRQADLVALKADLAAWLGA
jgi:carboxypeptidase C (cathepsin A)